MSHEQDEGSLPGCSSVPDTDNDGHIYLWAFAHFNMLQHMQDARGGAGEIDLARLVIISNMREVARYTLGNIDNGTGRDACG